MNQKKEDLALKYACAFLNTFVKTYSLTEYAIIEEAAVFFKARKKACYFMQLSLLDASLKLETLSNLANRLSLPPEYNRFFALLNKDHRIFLIPAFFRQLKAEYQRRALFLPVNIKSVLSLTHEQQKTLVAFLEQSTGMHIIPTYHLDPSLIAGIRITSGIYLFDHSLKTRLKNIFSSLH